MSSSQYTSQISVGDDVYGSDDDKVRTMGEFQSGYVVVEKRFFFHTNYYIPTSAIPRRRCSPPSSNAARCALSIDD